METSGEIGKILEDLVASVIEHNMHRQAQEAGNNFSDPDLNVNNVLEIFQKP